MKGDFTRVTFRPRAHFSGVRLQQGRVGLDADWNEQVDITAHRDETTTRDVIGPCGGPMGDAGFEISVAGDDIAIGAGRYYVDGLLCENEDSMSFGEQPDLPGADLPTAPGTYLAYLDVWTRHLTALEDRSLREVALGGADTATRTRTVWQVKLAAAGSSDTCLDFGPGWTPPDSASTGRLRAQSTPVPLELNECVVPPGSGYRRLENQLYRVEIHVPSGSGGPTFKWSRDNATVAARLESIEDLVLMVSDPGRDAVLGFAAGQTVELSDEGRVLRGEPGILVELDEVNRNELTITAWPGAPLTMDDFGDTPSVRRWDSPGALDVDAGDFVELEDGVEVEFSTGTLRTGDYWLIPARTLIGDVEWPRNGSGPEFQTRHGIEHHYCPLALLTLAGDETWSVESDCRDLFPPLTDLTSLYYVGGDGQEAMPDPTQPTQLIELAQPIEVGVANGEWPVEGARVRFEIAEGSGTLNNSTAPVDVFTSANGIAAAIWEIDSTTHVQRATATLLDAEEAPHHLQIHFSANLSEATHVAYDPGTCGGLTGSITVQSAIETVSSLAHLYYVGGDGQEGLPGAELSPLAVLVANDCGAIEGATVRFEVQAGDGNLDGTGPSVDVLTDGSGLAQCTWQLGTNDHRQQVLASLVDAPGVPVGLPGVAMFNANLSLAAEVAYDPSKCPNLSGADTVQEAIDLLCSSKDGGVEEGIRIERITLLSGKVLLNDSDVALQEFARGIRITCDRELDQNSVRFKPVVVVTLELPWPMTGDDAETWGGQFRVGFMPLILDAQTNSDNNEIFWVPAPQTAGWLADMLPQRMGDFELRHLLARLTVMGNFIWESENPRVFVDGDVFGRPRDGGTDIRLPSGDRRRGGDLRMWFRLRQG